MPHLSSGKAATTPAEHMGKELGEFSHLSWITAINIFKRQMIFTTKNQIIGPPIGTINGSYLLLISFIAFFTYFPQRSVLESVFSVPPSPEMEGHTHIKAHPVGLNITLAPTAAAQELPFPYETWEFYSVRASSFGPALRVGDKFRAVSS